MIPRPRWSLLSFLDVHPQITILAPARQEHFKSGTWQFGNDLTRAAKSEEVAGASQKGLECQGEGCSWFGELGSATEVAGGGEGPPGSW